MSKTREQVTEELRKRGKTIPQVAKELGFPVRAVQAVIYGHNKGYRGQAHEIAIALGMKEKPE